MEKSVIQLQYNNCGYWSVFAIAFIYSFIAVYLFIYKDVAKKCWKQEKVQQKKINGHR